MSIRWLGKSYGVLDLGGTKAMRDPRSSDGQSLLASQLDTRAALLAVEQQTLRTTTGLTQDALRRAIQDATEDAAEVNARIDRLERNLAGGRQPPVDLSPKYLYASLSANQTANLAAGNHVEFDDTLDTSGHVTVSTGAGQANGIFTLPVGVWSLSCVLDCTFSANASNMVLRWAVPGGAQLGLSGVSEPPTTTTTMGRPDRAEEILVVSSGTQDVEVRILSNVNLTSINLNRSRVIITALA